MGIRDIGSKNGPMKIFSFVFLGISFVNGKNGGHAKKMP
jgi:hypothetical protein